jgi:Ca2+-binding EF-hand superfamily protein
MKKSILTLSLAGLLMVPALSMAQDPPQRQQQQQQRQQQEPGQTQQSPEDVFTALDRDGNGKLSEAEFTAALGSQATDAQKKAEFAKWDSDGDKSISKDEFGEHYGQQGSR